LAVKFPDTQDGLTAMGLKEIGLGPSLRVLATNVVSRRDSKERETASVIKAESPNVNR